VLMDSSLHSANLTADEVSTSLGTNHKAAVEEEEDHHVHLPNPSFWPFILSFAIIVTLAGLLFVPANPWITVIALPFVLIAILGWALEDPMAPLQEHLETIITPRVVSRFQLGQEVYDKGGNWLGKIGARFSDRYILVESGGLLPRTYYVPQQAAKSSLEHNMVLLTMSEEELLQKGLTAIPDDLYEDVPEYREPQVTGVAQFGQAPLSPAETGHYNYGPNYPGINTDASGSYPREDVAPRPQRYVGARRKVYKDER
jgi:hypothetical protein